MSFLRKKIKYASENNAIYFSLEKFVYSRVGKNAPAKINLPQNFDLFWKFHYWF